MHIDRVKGLVSIVVTNYNNEKYIKECLDGLIHQSYTNIEIIIVDDYSTDNSLRIIKGWIDKISNEDKGKIKLLESPKNMGFSGAVTAGMYLARGEYIAMQDGDDISGTSRIEKQIKYLNDNNIMVVGCNYAIFENDVKSAVIKPNFVVYGEDAVKEDFAKGKSPVCFGTILFKASIFDDIGGLTRRLDGAEDYEFITKTIFFGIDNMKEALYYYRIHENQRSKEFYGNNKLRKNRTTKEKLSVLLVLDSFNIGGTETHVLSLAKELIRQGIKITILSGSGPLGVEFKKLDCKIYSLDFPTVVPKDKFVITNFITKIARIIKAEDINLIHGHQSTSGSLSLEVAKKLNIPYVFTIHGMYYHDIVFDYLKKADKVISVSFPVYQWLLNFSINSIVIPNGIIYESFINNNNDIKNQYNISNDSLLAIYCSRMAWGKVKVCENLIRVARDLRRNENINYDVLIIGNGPGYTELKEAGDRANNIIGKEIIHFAGDQLEVNKFYAASDCIIGTGRVAIEGMASCKNVIATGNSGYFGLVDSENFYEAWKLYFGDHGLKVENNAVFLYEDMKKYYLDKGKYNQDIASIYNMSKKLFDISQVTKEIVDVYLEVCK